MLASKVICDDTYSNKSWSIVTQGMFQLREINQMEREMCQYLEWELNVDPVTLREFEDMIHKKSPPRSAPVYQLANLTYATNLSPNLSQRAIHWAVLVRLTSIMSCLFPSAPPFFFSFSFFHSSLSRRFLVVSRPGSYCLDWQKVLLNILVILLVFVPLVCLSPAA